MDPNRYNYQTGSNHKPGPRLTVASKGPREQVASKGSGPRQTVASKGTREQVAGNTPRQAVASKSADNSPYTSQQPPQTCCLMDQNVRCHKLVGSGEFSDRIKESLKSIEKLKLKPDFRARHRNVCDYHNKLIGSALKSSPHIDVSVSSSDDNTDSNEEDECDEDEQGIDFSHFPFSTLQKYKQIFMIPGHYSMAELANVVSNHFRSIPVLANQDVIASEFIRKVKYTDLLEKTPTGNSNFS